MTNIAETMEKYNAHEITLEEANEALKESGIYLRPLTDAEREAKELRENELGFFDPEDRGFEPAPVLPEKPNMQRIPELAGQVVRQVTRRGTFDVYRNENGYAYKALRV